MSPEPRIFTLQEANALIPEVEKRFGHLLEMKEQYIKRHDELFLYELLAQAEHEAGLTTDPQDLEKEIHSLEEAIQGLEKYLKDIQALGGVIRNIKRGEVDFLGRLGDEYVYFCWQRGEKQIRHYHSLKGGKMERKRLGRHASRGEGK